MVSVSHEIARNLLYIMSERVRYSNLVIADSLDMQRKYQRFATTDALTGLHNRGWLDDAFDRELKRSERDELPLSLLMLDVDNFKKYNDDAPSSRRGERVSHQDTQLLCCRGSEQWGFRECSNPCRHQRLPWLGLGVSSERQSQCPHLF